MSAIPKQSICAAIVPCFVLLAGNLVRAAETGVFATLDAGAAMPFVEYLYDLGK